MLYEMSNEKKVIFEDLLNNKEGDAAYNKIKEILHVLTTKANEKKEKEREQKEKKEREQKAAAAAAASASIQITNLRTKIAKQINNIYRDKGWITPADELKNHVNEITIFKEALMGKVNTINDVETLENLAKNVKRDYFVPISKKINATLSNFQEYMRNVLYKNLNKLSGGKKKKGKKKQKKSKKKKTRKKKSNSKKKTRKNK